MNAPTISIIVPTRDRAHVLGECLASLIAQRTKPLEILVVDDRSTDNTTERVAHAAPRAEAAGIDLRRIPNDTSGVNAARNVGLRHARGDLIVFVDDDVDPPGDWLSAIVSGAARHPTPLCFAGPIRLRIEGPSPSSCGQEQLGTELDYGSEEREVERAWTANMTIRREAVDLVGTFDETIPVGAGDEEQWVIRLLDRGGRIVYLPDAWLWHRRVAADLRVRKMLRARFRRGFHQVPFFRWAGMPSSRSRDVVAAISWVGHAVRRGCRAGLLEAAQCAGRAWGATRNHRVIG